MKRSEINDYIKSAKEFFTEQKFFLPKFAFWTINDWKSKGTEIKEIIENQLGWDISDFGSDDFSKMGLILFTIRNGRIGKGQKDYCEKIMIIDEGQKCPMHYHFHKTEDIINRGGGNLMVILYNVTDDNNLADTPVIVSIDGVEQTLDAGSIVKLTPGESITLTDHLYHQFWPEKGTGKVLIGEVSSVNDDRGDNYFLKKIERFIEIEEDVEPTHLLYADYERLLKF